MIEGRPYTIFSEHLADLELELIRTHALLRSLEAQKSMLIEQERQFVVYRENLVYTPEPQNTP